MTATEFRALHHGDPLVLPNVWDVVSARVFAEEGFPALATASTAIAAVLGYADGEKTPRDEMFAAIARIARGAGVPVSADVEAGYGLEPKELVDRLLEAGVVGCNLEDSDPATGVLVDAGHQADRLAAVRAAAGDALVINARIDVFLAGGTVAEAIDRARRYLEAGADCVYPIFAPLGALPEFVAAVDAPVNVHHRQGGPTPAELGTLGASRITFGGDLHKAATAHLRELALTLR
jgi:2-methylisocitrate lyase-like PEP mutase family enzyme